MGEIHTSVSSRVNVSLAAGESCCGSPTDQMMAQVSRRTCKAVTLKHFPVTLRHERLGQIAIDSDATAPTSKYRLVLFLLLNRDDPGNRDVTFSNLNLFTKSNRCEIATEPVLEFGNIGYLHV